MGAGNARRPVPVPRFSDLEVEHDDRGRGAGELRPRKSKFQQDRNEGKTSQSKLLRRSFYSTLYKFAKWTGGTMKNVLSEELL